LIGSDAFNKFDRTNMIERRIWSRIQARKRATEVRESLKGRTVVVLGQEVWVTLALPMCTWFHAIIDHDGLWYKVPHFSGRNRMYNDADNLAKAKTILLGVANGF